MNYKILFQNKFNSYYLWTIIRESTIQVKGYAAKEANASLTPFSFERRDLLDYWDVMIQFKTITVIINWFI